VGAGSCLPGKPLSQARTAGQKGADEGESREDGFEIHDLEEWV